jgi:hypothetical protein
MLRVSIFLSLSVLAACSRDQSGAPQKDPDQQDKAGSATLTGASFTTRESAVDRITAARCAREVTCSNIGADKHFTTSDKCVTEVKERLDSELGPNECPDGIDARQVDECLDAIRAESCTNAMSTVQRLAQCRTGSLCIKPPGRPLF